MPETWIERHDGENVRVTMHEFRDREYIDIRIYFQDQDGEWHPTRKGVKLTSDKLRELMEALESLVS